MRLLFICIDGMELERAMPHVISRLPTDASNIRYGKLSVENADLCSTGPSWTSIFTGMRAEEHGVTHITGVPQGGSKGFGDLVGRYLFEQLPGSVGCLALPTTYPPRARPGDWMVSGYPFRPMCKPVGLLDGIDYISDYAAAINKVRKDRGDGWFWPDEHEWPDAFMLMKMIEEFRLSALHRLPGVDHLFVFNGLYDRMGHQCHNLGHMAQGEPLDAAAKYVGEWVQRLVKGFPADLTVLCSDHGWDQATNAHALDGFWAMFGQDVAGGKRQFYNYQLLDEIKTVMAKTDPDVWDHMAALGYVEAQ